MQLSRALTDRRLADAVLEQGVQNALALLRQRPESTSRGTCQTSLEVAVVAEKCK
jgi:hypothetical protein